MKRSALAIGFGVEGRVKRCLKPRAAPAARAWRGRGSRGAIVGVNALEGDAVLLEESQGGAEEGDGALGSFIREEFGESETAVIVDGDVEELPACARSVIVPTVAGAAMALAPDAGELLDVEMEEFALGCARSSRTVGGGAESCARRRRWRHSRRETVALANFAARAIDKPGRLRQCNASTRATRKGWGSPVRQPPYSPPPPR